MRRFHPALSLLHRYLQLLGFSPIQFLRFIVDFPRIANDFFALSRQIASRPRDSRLPSTFALFPTHPIVGEATQQSGIASGHYFHQDLYVAHKIFLRRPSLHLDIGSRIDGFIAHLLSFEQPVLIGDIRPLTIQSRFAHYLEIDITDTVRINSLPKYSSISSLHAVEHMGLGRYGDPINSLGHIQAILNLSSLLTPGGTLYLSFPFSRVSSIEFNSQRLMTLEESRTVFEMANLSVIDFAYVDDRGSLVAVDDLDAIDYDNSYSVLNGCAIFSLVRNK